MTGIRDQMEQFGDEKLNETRHRAWVFTINNYTEDDTDAVYALGEEAAYVSVGREVGDKGTPHYQGFVMFETLKAFGQVKALLVRAWMAPKAKLSTFKQAIDYTQKDNDFYESGTRPIDAAAKGELERQRAERNLQAVMEKRYDDVDPDVLVSQLRNYEYAAARVKAARAGPPAALDGVLDNMWVYGDAGVGKDTFVNSLAPDAYIKDPDTRWWDGYDGQEDVIIRDLGPDHDPRLVKIWADRYPFPAEVKGATLGNIRPKRTFVTTNYAPEQVYDAPDLDAVERRFQIIHAHDGVAEYRKRRLVLQPPPLRPVCYDVDAGIERGESAARFSNALLPFTSVSMTDPDPPSDQESDHDPPSPDRFTSLEARLQDHA